MQQGTDYHTVYSNFSYVFGPMMLKGVNHVRRMVLREERELEKHYISGPSFSILPVKSKTVP